jgi:NAD(P)-dependent dehydrogenase (short-subunit alcohol dehydrogenase family)
MNDWSIRDRTVLITGATSGIGYATAEELARLGARLALVSRDPRRGEDARRRLAEASGSSQIEVLQADLASMDSIRRFAETFRAGHDRLDVLINNAGLMSPRRQFSKDGIELTFAVNVVAPFLVTNLLLDRLKASAPSRIVNVSSAAHLRAGIDLDDLQFRRRRYWMMSAYGQSKLALNLLTVEWSRRLAGTGVTANALHPGTVATNFGNWGGVLGLGYKLVGRFMLPPSQGAQTPAYLAASPEVATVSGAYFDNRRPAKPNPLALDPNLAARLWNALEALTSE